MKRYSAMLFTTVCPKCGRELTRRQGNLYPASTWAALKHQLERHQRDPAKCRPVPMFTVVVTGPTPPLGYYQWKVAGTNLSGGVGGGNERTAKARALEAGREALTKYLNREMNRPSQDEHGQGD